MDINNIPDTNYIHIERWMYKLGLNMSEIAIYACIHGFCQDGISCFTGSHEYLQVWANAGRSTVYTAIKKMIGMNLLGKKYVMFKGKPYPVFYTVRSREMYSNMVQMNRQISEKVSSSFVSPEIGLKSENKTESVQKLDNDSPESGPNNIANNIFKKAAAENENSDFSEETENPSEKNYGSAAAAIISQKISENLGSDPYSESFIYQIEKAVLDEGFSDREIPDYISFACERAKAKNPKNIYGLFKTIAAAPDVISDFKNEIKNQKKKAEDLYECPVCHQKHSKYLDSCIRCGLLISDRNNPEKITQQKLIYSLPEDQREAFDREICATVLGYDFLSLRKPEVREKRKAEQKAIYEKYGIPYIDEGVI